MNEKPKVSQFGSVDPAPPLTTGEVDEWELSLTDDNTPMFQRMRNVFALRNKGTDAACMALCSDSTLKAHYYDTRLHMFWDRCRTKLRFLH